MLAGHEERDHHMRNFPVVKKFSIAVFLLHESSNHVMFVLALEVRLKLLYLKTKSYCHLHLNYHFVAFE